MKYYATESNLNFDKRAKLESDMQKFIENGGSVTGLDSRGMVIKETFKNDISASNKKRIADQRQKQTTEKDRRLSYQRPVLVEYSNKVKISGKWSALTRRVGCGIAHAQITKVFYGLASIADEKLFAKVRDVVNEMIAEYEIYESEHGDQIKVLKKMGIACPEKISRIIEQKPFFDKYSEAFPDDKYFTNLSDKINKAVSPKHLRNTASMSSSIADPQKWKKVKTAILEMIEEKQNEEKKAS